MTSARQVLDRAMSERELQQTVIEMARLYQWRGTFWGIIDA